VVRSSLAKATLKRVVNMMKPLPEVASGRQNDLAKQQLAQRQRCIGKKESFLARNAPAIAKSRVLVMNQTVKVILKGISSPLF
jgi:hypothetical protein